MRQQEIRTLVNLPEASDVLRKYARYSKFLATPAGQELLAGIMTAEVFVLAKAAVAFGYPAVLPVGDIITKVWSKHGIEPGDFISKQFAGSAICVLMEANGYRKLGKKRRVPHPAFNRAERYEPLSTEEDIGRAANRASEQASQPDTRGSLH